MGAVIAELAASAAMGCMLPPGASARRPSLLGGKRRCSPGAGEVRGGSGALTPSRRGQGEEFVINDDDDDDTTPAKRGVGGNIRPDAASIQQGGVACAGSSKKIALCRRLVEFRSDIPVSSPYRTEATINHQPPAANC